MKLKEEKDVITITFFGKPYKKKHIVIKVARKNE